MRRDSLAFHWIAMTIAITGISRGSIAQEAQVQPSQAVADPPLVAQDPQTDPETEFLRLVSREDGPQALELAIVTYAAEAAEGVSVDLIAAVHVGQRSYYEALNQQFDQYDVLLYELVAPEGTKIPLGGKREGRGFNPLAMLQDSTKDMLGLESQLELVDYTKSHFVRADLTPQQLSDKMAERGETFVSIALSTLSDAIRQQNLAVRAGDASPEMLELSLFDMFGNPLKMKRALAQQFAGRGAIDQALGGALNQLLIKDRNQAALRGLQKQIAAGKKRIGIFYGAAHMPDLEQHLIDDFGLKKTQQTWLAAWDLTAAKEPDHSEPVQWMLNLLKALK